MTTTVPVAATAASTSTPPITPGVASETEVATPTVSLTPSPPTASPKTAPLVDSPRIAAPSAPPISPKGPPERGVDSSPLTPPIGARSDSGLRGSGPSGSGLPGSGLPGSGLPDSGLPGSGPPAGGGLRLPEDRRILAGAGGILALVLAGILILVLTGGSTRRHPQLTANTIAQTNPTTTPPTTSAPTNTAAQTSTTGNATAGTNATAGISTTATVGNTGAVTTGGSAATGTTGVGPAATGSGSGTSGAASGTPLAALNSYWQNIGARRYGDAYNGLAPGAISFSRSSFVSQERQAGITNVSFHGYVISDDGTSAIIGVDSLTTHDTQFGCRNWTGTYKMVNQGSQWLIEKAIISPRPCG